MALLGPSGGGKTTVLRMSPAWKCHRSDLFIRGQRVNDILVQQRNIGFASRITRCSRT